MALRAHLDDDAATVLGAAGLERVAAPTEHRGLRVGGVNVSFHDSSSISSRVDYARSTATRPKQWDASGHSRRASRG
ncbi:hypothetical protein L837_2633 [Mycobacterium avium MAV_061107_1842]|nr:hypothetical protein L837_2633 [Mycobacterium avium MAV_061107_1842]